MAITKNVLNQYFSEKQEIEEVKEKIYNLEKQIERLEKRISEIEDGQTVKDKVRGGLGGLESFVIEGVPYNEYNSKLAELEFKRRMITDRRNILDSLEKQLLLRTNEVEIFINSIEDSFTRRLFALRIFEKRSWKEIAEKMGGNNNENNVKKIFQRYCDKKL